MNWPQVRADVRWALAPRPPGGGGGGGGGIGARCSQPWLRGLLRAVRGDGAAAAGRDAPGWRVQASVLHFDGGAEEGEEEEQEEQEQEQDEDEEEEGGGDGWRSDESG